MKTKSFLAALLMMVAGLQTTWAQGFRVYKSDGTVAQFSMKTDSIVFSDGFGGDADFGPYTPVNQCIVGTWYKSKSETVTFNEDGTTNWLEGATYKFLFYQGIIVIYNAAGVPVNIIRVYDITSTEIIASTLGSNGFFVLSTTPPAQLVTEIVLSETSIRIMPGETRSLTAYCYPNDAVLMDVTWTSSNEEVATVDADGLVTAVAGGSCVITCAAKDGSGVKAECAVTVPTDVIDGHEYVMIGGVKWATMNLGATTISGSYETCFGDYYAWGFTEPFYETMSLPAVDGDATFTWKSGYYNGYNYYTDFSGSTILNADHDAATAAWGNKWKMPTQGHFRSLLVACTGSMDEEQTPETLTGKVVTGGIYWLTANQTYEPEYTGVVGVLFVSKDDTSKRLFFPAAGYIGGKYYWSGNSAGYYWSASDNTSETHYAYALQFRTTVNYLYSWPWYQGGTIRPVSY